MEKVKSKFKPTCGILFWTSTHEPPMSKHFTNETSRNEEMEQVIETSKISFGDGMVPVIMAQKYTCEGVSYINYDLLKQQYQEEQKSIDARG